jgi:hypothetical protein
MKKLLFTAAVAFGCTTGLFAQVPNYVPSNGLDAYYTFQSNAIDVSGNNHDGVTNGASLVPDKNGISNSAYSFNGISDYIQLNNPFLGGQTVNAFSFYTRFKINNVNRYGIWGKTLDWGEVNLLVLQDGSLNFSWYNNNNLNTCSDARTNTGVIEQGMWYDVVICFENSIAVIYINGIPTTTNLTYSENCINLISNSFLNSECRFNQDVNSSKFGLETVGGIPTYFFNGIIDEFGVWNRVLNQCEILDLYNNQINWVPINAGQDQTICKGDSAVLLATGANSYQWNNNVINGQIFLPIATSEYIVTGTDINGCIGTDSVNVIVNNTSSSSQTQTALDSYTWAVNEQTYTQSGTYSDTLVNAEGCDSIVTLNLTLNYTGINELTPNHAKKLVKITDLNGKETPFKRNTILLFIYEDGTVERVYVEE